MTPSNFLLSAQLSVLSPPAHIVSIPLQTSRQNLPLPTIPADADLPVEHASFASVFYASHTGSILLRLLHGGLVVELSSLSSDVPPIRFVFPAPVLPAPGISAYGNNEIHLLALTTSGSLYRLVLPASSPTRLWHEPLSKNWCREYLIKATSDKITGVSLVHGVYCVAVGLSNGSLLRVETEQLGDDVSHDFWNESLVHPNSFLGSFTSFLPNLNSGGSEIVALASHPQPIDISNFWSLSRDRTLRLWTAKGGCVASKPLSTPGRALTPSLEGRASSAFAEGRGDNLLRVFSVINDAEQHIYVLAFIPTPAAPNMGGYFHLIDSTADSIREMQVIECSSSSIHCHLQDFFVTSGTLYLLWEKQGTSLVERTKLALVDSKAPLDLVWEAATHGEETELTPTYLDELLLSPGSLTDKFVEAILRPGVFSPLTLQTAIDQYTQACLSLPGPPPSQLVTPYLTLAENITAVVGCTVSLLRDPSTGVLQYANYWSALKRDWEGFIARCRELERSARWPLALGIGDTSGTIMAVERERVGILAVEDLPLRTHRQLTESLPVEQHFLLLDIIWTLCDKLGNEALLALETAVVDLLHQEIAFSTVDIIQDQALRLELREKVDEATEESIYARLQSLEDLDRDVRTIIDLVAGFDQEVKKEEDEVELLLPCSRSEWCTALTTAYVSTTVHARYDISLALITLLFFISEDLTGWDHSLIEEIFAVFRGLAMLRSVARQPAGDITNNRSKSSDGSATDEVIARMNDMQVSSSHYPRGESSFPLLHRLLAQNFDISELPSAAHRFLDATGMLQSTSPAHVTSSEVLFCERARLLGYCEVSRELLLWLPRTPAVTFSTACLWIEFGRPDDAALLLEKAAGSFAGANSGLSFEDAEALGSVIPGGKLYDSEYIFYLHMAALFKTYSLTQHEVAFIQHALMVSTPDFDTEDLWLNLIRGYIELGRYEDAYTSILTTPYDHLKRDCIGDIVYRMCEDNAVEKLMSLIFTDLANEVEDALAFKARNTDPRVRPFYSRILYTWYTMRGDHRNASRTMYHRARKLAEDPQRLDNIIEPLEDQLESFMLALNSLSLCDSRSAWFTVPIVNDSTTELRTRHRVTKNIPKSNFSEDHPDLEIVDIEAVRFDYTLVTARLQLIKKDPSLLSAPDLLMSPAAVILKLGQTNQFDMAMTMARDLKVDMGDLFAMMTTQCLRLARDPAGVLQEDTSDWLVTDKVSSWPGTAADRGWRYLRQALEQHDGPKTDHKYTKSAYETVLAFDRSPPPPWLINSLEEQHPEYLIRTSLRFDAIVSAMEHTLSLVKKSDKKVAHIANNTVYATWLPYTLIDQVLAAAASQNDLGERGQTLRKELQAEINNRIKRMQKMSRLST
ncbi:hypothetical protein CONPUDRAFT_123432 [Coniophora puteana RWD-64-598 SS2]|uniref:Nucleoporin n=1 Tax=Coniophora puteana (strain RWD-64-598) TaxID=741705 RepID=A0A5M3MTP5_CONPW|nr:uncharacterized protein CONPUDRAFT_123432 [Coniophora puteana RWD-64-598 SS2]EIW82466.1 hypothetical protein CONPUDRAFT_123432 [Coniophora puteana RWD-64-598 SS2]